MNDFDRALVYDMIRNIYRCQCQVWRSTNLSLAAATWTLLPFDTTIYDHVPHKQTAMFVPATSTSRVYARIAGVYSITAYATFDTDTALKRIAILRNSAGTFTAANIVTNVATLSISASFPTGFGLAATKYMDIGDYIEMFVRQDSAGALNLLTLSYSPLLSMSYLGE